MLDMFPNQKQSRNANFLKGRKLYLMNGCTFISHTIQFLVCHFLNAIVFFLERPDHLIFWWTNYANPTCVRFYPFAH